MKHESHILEIPVDKAKSAVDLADWFELNELTRKKHPTLSLPVKEEFPIVVMGLFLVIAMALILLEEKGKLKVKKKAETTSPEDFLELMKRSKTETGAEKMIESRYNLDLVVSAPPSQASIVSEPAAEYGLGDAFGIWKNKKDTLAKVRETQWGKRK